MAEPSATHLALAGMAVKARLGGPVPAPIEGRKGEQEKG